MMSNHDETEQKLKQMGETWNIQDEQIEAFEPNKYATPPWMVLKAVLAVIILTTVYLLYSLPEIPWSLAETYGGMLVFGGVPFFVAFVLGMTMENGKLALIFALAVGMISIFIMFILFNLPYTMELFEYGGGHTNQMWWYVFLTFISLISLMPVGAVLASSTNVYE